MKKSSKNRLGKMGVLNNRIVELIDKSDLTPPEIFIVLDTVRRKVQEIFNAVVEEK